MKPFGFGILILLVAFIIGAYALWVPWAIIQRLKAGDYEGTGLNALNDFFNSLYNALQLGLLAVILGIIGTLVFFVEFSGHGHASQRVPPSPSQGVRPIPVQSTMTCWRCRNHITSDSRFCPKCGADLFPELTKT